MDSAKSPPARGRGLKQYFSRLASGYLVVAPCAGAWIETQLFQENRGRYRSSPPARGRGLKLALERLAGLSKFVAPCAGAWIETRYEQ